MHTNVRWMPPEVIAERTFSNASDVWSFGILQWEMFWPNRHPYHKMGNLEVATKVCEVVGGDRVGYISANRCSIEQLRLMSLAVKQPEHPPILLISNFYSDLRNASSVELAKYYYCVDCRFSVVTMPIRLSSCATWSTIERVASVQLPLNSLFRSA